MNHKLTTAAGFKPKIQFGLKSRPKPNPASGQDRPPSTVKPNAFGEPDDGTYKPTLRFDDEEDAARPPKRLCTTAGPDQQGEAAVPTKCTNTDPDDELDAFMAGIDRQVASEAQAEPNMTKVDAHRFDNEDPLENLEAAGPVGLSDHPLDISGMGSDEEVYATERHLADLENEVPTDPGKTDVVPLEAVDHSEFAYSPLRSTGYTEHPAVAALDREDVWNLHRQWGVQVRGSALPKPGTEFVHFGLSTPLQEIIDQHQFAYPTVIQRLAVPAALLGRDLVGISPTGSGKTLAFILPLIIHLTHQAPLAAGEGPGALIVAPTRELAQQIHKEARTFARAHQLRCLLAYGGTNKMDQFKELRHQRVDILVATPGRLIDLVRMRATTLRRVSYLVIDEADQMFSLGFEAQVRSVCDRVRPDRQTLLFSATMPSKIERLVEGVMRDPLRITIGQVGEPTADVDQHFVVVNEEVRKWDWLQQHVPAFCVEGSVLIFVAGMGQADELAEGLAELGVTCGTLHSSMTQQERDRSIRKFKSGDLTILVATDVGARGLDVKSVRTVINHSMARDINTYVHRIGRTGRAGVRGDAYTFLTDKQKKLAQSLVRLLSSTGKPVPANLRSLAGPEHGRKQSNHSRQTVQSIMGHHMLAGARLGGDRTGLGTSHQRASRRPASSGSRSFGVSFQAARETSGMEASSSASRPPPESRSPVKSETTLNQSRRKRWDQL